MNDTKVKMTEEISKLIQEMDNNSKRNQSDPITVAINMVTQLQQFADKMYKLGWEDALKSLNISTKKENN